MDELISRQKAKDAIDMALDHIDHVPPWVYDKLLNALNEVPSAQPTLYGYDINQLASIAIILKKENLPPERVAEALSDMGSIVAMAYDEFTESLRKAVEQCTI